MAKRWVWMIAGAIALFFLVPQKPVAADDAISVAIMSDTQFWWWRGGANPDCGPDDDDCKKKMGNLSNAHVKNAIRNITDIGTWPSGEGVIKPKTIIVNGDLTAYFQDEELEEFESTYYPTLDIQFRFGFNLYPGLGNHDYSNNVSPGPDCDYKDIYWPDYSRCAKEAVWWLGRKVASLPGVVNVDMPRLVALDNEGAFDARLTVTYSLNGESQTGQSDAFEVAQSRGVAVPQKATDVHYKLEYWDGFNWQVQKEGDLGGPSVPSCFRITGDLVSRKVFSDSCHEYPDGSRGSASYSFDVGNYHFVQLNLSPGYTRELPSKTSLLNVVSFGVIGLSPSFTVTESYDWLKEDLAAATKAGKYSVINMHSFADTNYGYDEQRFADAVKDSNTIAIFSGHVHPDYGSMPRFAGPGGSLSVPLGVDIGSARGIPWFRSGSVECERFLLAEFHEDHYNVGVISAKDGQPKLVTDRTDVCDSRRSSWDDQHYERNDADPSPDSFTLNRNIPVTIPVNTPRTVKGNTTTTISGTYGDPGQDVTLSVDWGDGTVETADLGTNGTTFSVAHAYTRSGHFTVTISLSDARNAVGTTRSDITVDNDPPVTGLTLVGPGPQNGWYGGQVSVTLLPTDVISGVASTSYSVDGGPVLTYTGPFNVAGDAKHTLAFWSVDQVGNQEAQKSQGIWIDATVPVTKASVPAPTGANGWYKTTPVTVTLTAQDNLAGIAKTVYRIDGGPSVTYSGPFAVPANAKHVVTYSSVDVAGNTESSHSLQLLVDATAPVTQASVPAANGSHNWYTASPVTVTLLATDDLSGVAKTVYVIDGGQPQTYTAPFVVSGDFKHTITYSSADVAGNTEVVRSLTLLVDTTAPLLTASASPNALWPPSGKLVTVIVSGRISDNLSGVDTSTGVFSTVDEYGTVQPNGRFAINPDGTYSFTIALEASRGGGDIDGRSYIVTLQALDLAGNLGRQTVAISVPHDQGSGTR